MTEAQKLDLALWRMVGVRNARTKRFDCYARVMREKDRKLTSDDPTKPQPIE